MANQPLQIVKTVSAPPIPLAPNVIYLVRVGQGYDLYATDTTGSSAYKINVSPSQLTDAISIANGGTGATSLSLARDNLGVYSKSDVDSLLNTIKPTPHRYWRITNIATVDDATNLGVRHVATLDFNVSGNIVSTFSNSAAANNYTLYGAQNAFDGNVNTFAHSADTNEGDDTVKGRNWYIGCQFDVAVLPTSLTIQPRQVAQSYYTEWVTADVQYSDDGVNWKFYGNVAPNFRYGNLFAKTVAITNDVSAPSANKLSAPRIISYTGDVTGSVSFDGSKDVSTTLTLNNLTPFMLPKIGSSQKYYQSGLRHGADYPYPYLPSTLTSINGAQYFVPFTALEDAIISALEIYCSTAQSNATVSLGIYASDSNNDVSNPLFTSNPINCSAVGAKNAPCNVKITKGKVYWLSSMVIGSPAFFRDSLKSIKGNTSSNQGAIIGYYTIGNTSMAQSAPTNKVDLVGQVPRVMFITS